MLFLIFSDAHGSHDGMRRALDMNPDVKNVLFLGDGIRDLHRITPLYPTVNFRAVRGNMDELSLAFSAEDEDFFELHGTRVLMMHGHRYGVKGGLSAAEGRALRLGAKVLLYGHTHEPYLHYDSETGLYTFNPGSIGRPYHGNPTFGLLDILPNGDVSLSHGELPLKFFRER